MVFDLLVLGLVLAAAVVGAWKGFAWQIAHVLSAVAGLGLGWPLSALLGPPLGIAAPLDRLAAFGILYLAISLVVHLCALGLRKSLERRRLASWDHHVGFVAGAMKGTALALLLTLAAMALSVESAAAVRSSRMGRLMGDVAVALRPALPAEVRAVVDPVLEPREPEL